ncbi:MAG: hypothetical protein ACMXYD_02500 [Candidatus Woesearchaeota archaeon]
MGEQTDYSVLLIVACVAVVAMVVMIQPSFSSSQKSLAGAATANADVLVYALATGVCPAGYVCDVNNDGVIDERDLAVINQQETSYTKPAVISASTHRSVVVGYHSIATTLA